MPDNSPLGGGASAATGVVTALRNLTDAELLAIISAVTMDRPGLARVHAAATERPDSLVPDLPDDLPPVPTPDAVGTGSAPQPADAGTEPTAPGVAGPATGSAPQPADAQAGGGASSPDTGGGSPAQPPGTGSAPQPSGSAADTAPTAAGAADAATGSAPQPSDSGTDALSATAGAAGAATGSAPQLPTSEPTVVDAEIVPEGAPGPGYTAAGVPTFDGVRDKVEHRYGTSVGAEELDEQSPAGRAVAAQWEARQRAGHERLEQIRRSMQRKDEDG